MGEILSAPGADRGTRGAQTPRAAQEALDKLEVAPPGSMAGYSREKFSH